MESKTVKLTMVEWQAILEARGAPVLSPAAQKAWDKLTKAVYGA